MGKIRGVSSGQANTIRLYHWKDRGGFHHTLSQWYTTAIENCMCSALTWCMMLHKSLTYYNLLCMQHAGVKNCFPQILAILLNDENKWTNKTKLCWFITKQMGLSLAVWDISLIWSALFSKFVLPVLAISAQTADMLDLIILFMSCRFFFVFFYYYSVH